MVPPLSVDAKIRGPSPERQEAKHYAQYKLIGSD